MEPQMNTDERRSEKRGSIAKLFLNYLCSSVFICGSFLFTGCKDAVEVGHNTALDSVDLVQMTDSMAMKLIADPNVQQHFADHGKLKIVVEPVKNELTAEVLPRGEAEAFTGRVRSLLAKHSPDEFTWIMNRDAFYDMRNKELDFDLGPSPDAIDPQYALTATFAKASPTKTENIAVNRICAFMS